MWDYVTVNCAKHDEATLTCFPSKATVTGGLGRRSGATDSKHYVTQRVYFLCCTTRSQKVRKLWTVPGVETEYTSVH